MALLDFAKKKRDQVVGFLKENPTPASFVQKKVTEYFKPTGEVRTRDIVREYPGAVKQSLSSPLKTFASTPKATFADDYSWKENPIKKFAATVPQEIINTPVRAARNIGQTGLDIQDMVRRKQLDKRKALQIAGRTGEQVLDALSMGKGKAVLATGNQFLKGVKPLGQLMKEGGTQGLKTGMGYGAGYGASQGVQDENATVGSVAKNTAVGTLAGGVLGGALGGGLPALGALPGSVRNSIKNRLNKPQVTDTIPAHYVSNGRKPVAVREGERPIFPPLPANERFSSGVKKTSFDEVVQSPTYSAKTERLIPAQQKTNRAVPTLSDWSREVREAMPAPGMSIQDVSKEKNLIVQHNLSDSKLMNADRIGGLPVPSIAIGRKEYPMTNFGDITLLGDKGLIDPSYRENKVFNTDAYSKRYPSIKYNAKNEYPLRDQMRPLSEKVKTYFTNDDAKMSSYSYDDFFGDLENAGRTAIENRPLLKQIFAMQGGVKRDATGDEIRKFVTDNGKAYQSFIDDIEKNLDIEEKIFKGYTYSGNRRYAPHTLENIVKEMTGKVKDSEGYDYGAGSLRAVGAKQYRSIESIQKDRNKIIPSAEMEKIKNEINEEYSQILDEMGGNGGFGDTASVAKDYIAGRIKYGELGQYGINTSAIPRLLALAEKLKKLPTEYFEAKPQRAVGIGEFKSAVIPDDTSDEVISVLRKYGVNIEKYVSGSDESRKKIIQNVINNNSQMAFGAVAGVEMDENGNVSFSPEKAALGVGLMAGMRRGKVKQIGKDDLSVLTSVLGKNKNIAVDPVKSVPPLPGKMDEIVKAEADAMIDMQKSAEGPVMLNTGYDYLPGSGEFHRISDNPQWYRDFYKRNGRAPGKKEILAIAKENLENGRGYLQDEFERAKNPTPDDVNESLLSFGRREPTKAEIFQQPPRIFKNREYPQAEPIPGSIVAPSRTLPAGREQLMLPPGQTPTMRPTQAKQFIAKYGQAPEVKTEIKSTRPVYVGESGQASFSRNKAGAADVAEALGDTEFSDIGIVAKGNLDIVRNFRNFFGKRSQEFVDKYIAPFQQSKDTMYRNLEKEADNLDKVIVKGLGIERGSRESAAVQELGEGLRDEASLVKDFGETKARNIVMANQWFRAQYDRMLAEVNKARSYVYPNQPDKQIQKRDDYYRHFRELQDGFQGLANIFETPAGIDNKLAGISNQTKPNSKWLSFAQKRLGAKTDVDAVGGFIDYLGAAEYAKNVDPKIHGFRQLAEQVAEQGNKEGKDYNNFVGFLERTADHLSGKTNSLDRGIQEFTGRKAFRAVDWVNRRVKANTILGNASSSLAQVFALPAGISSAGEKNFYKGTKRLVGSIGKDDVIMRQSPFLRERYFNALDKFDKGTFNNTKKLAVWMVTALDEMSTKATWNAHYEKALSEGIQNPIKYADEITGNIVGRRGIGETPLLQQSKTFQMIAPFQLEVANAWPLMKELSDSGKAKLVKLLVYTYVLNRGVEAVRGSDVAFDPIQAGIDGFQSAGEEDTFGGKVRAIGGRMAGEVLSNVPLGQTMAGLYPEYGAKDVLGSGVDLPTREKLFGKGDPTRFGSGLLVAKGIQDFKYKVLPPFGGAQIKRTVDGLKSFAQGYKENAGGKVQYPIEQNLRNFIQGGVFGPSSVPEGRSYYKDEKTPLGDVQSEKFKLGGGKDYYEKVMNDRQADKEKTAIKGKGTVDVAKASGSVDGIKQLSNGKFYVQDLDKEFTTEKAAEKAVAIESWKNSDEEILEYGGKYYYKDDTTESGYRSKTLESKKKEDTNKDVTLSKEKMQSYKSSKDVDSWLKEADVLYKKYDKMLRAETDEVERLKIENDMKTLATQFNKYKSYGGYTKPKKAKKIDIPSMDDADFIVKKMSSRLRPLRAFGRSRTNLASVARPNIRRPKRLS